MQGKSQLSKMILFIINDLIDFFGNTSSSYLNSSLNKFDDNFSSRNNFKSQIGKKLVLITLEKERLAKRNNGLQFKS